MGGQASWGSMSNHNRCPLVWSERSAWKFTCPHCNQFLLMASETDIPLWVGVCKAWQGCASPTPVKPTPRGSVSKTIPQEDDGLANTQHQARKTSLGWINGKLWLLPWMSARISTEDGWSSRWCVVNVDVFIDRMANRIVFMWCRNWCQPIDTFRQWNGWPPWLLTELEHGSKTKGVWNGYTPLCVKLFDEELSSTLMQNTPSQPLRDSSHQC